MARKKYLVRSGFVVVLKIAKPDGGYVERTYQENEEVALEDADAELHRHKLEFASQRDRDAALAAEKEAAVKVAGGSNPAELVAQLVAALQMSQQAGAAAAAAPAA